MKSPCKKECKLENLVCQGCGRTLDEIKNWVFLTDEQREAIIRRLKGPQDHDNSRPNKKV
jgi:predicted Fe-S protein YdhL (DUF1289 family)